MMRVLLFSALLVGLVMCAPKPDHGSEDPGFESDPANGGSVNQRRPDSLPQDHPGGSQDDDHQPGSGKQFGRGDNDATNGHDGSHSGRDGSHAGQQDHSGSQSNSGQQDLRNVPTSASDRGGGSGGGGGGSNSQFNSDNDASKGHGGGVGFGGGSSSNPDHNGPPDDRDVNRAPGASHHDLEREGPGFERNVPSADHDRDRNSPPSDRDQDRNRDQDRDGPDHDRNGPDHDRNRDQDHDRNGPDSDRDRNGPDHDSHRNGQDTDREINNRPGSQRPQDIGADYPRDIANPENPAKPGDFRDGSNPRDHDQSFDPSGRPMPPHEGGNFAGVQCREDMDCPTYSYCYAGVCQTKFVHQNGGQSCLKLGKDGSKILDHEKCRLTDAEVSGVPIVYATARCFKELNYNCARSLYMPCSPNYDDNDEIIKGQEEACPTHFNCTLKKYGPAQENRAVKLCVPDKRSSEQPQSGAQTCGTNFECGFDVIEADLDDGWARCQANSCKKYNGGGGPPAPHSFK